VNIDLSNAEIVGYREKQFILYQAIDHIIVIYTHIFMKFNGTQAKILMNQWINIIVNKF